MQLGTKSELPDKVSEGDLVAVYESSDGVKLTRANSGVQYETRNGIFRPSTFPGLRYGGTARARTTSATVNLLRPTPEIFTRALTHRTQICYEADLAFIVEHLGLRPGSVIVEAGTGSLSAAVTFARSCMPNGLVISCEFHEGRARAAKEDVESLNLGGTIKILHRNAQAHGFPVPERASDCAFLDVPQPHAMVASAKKSLREGGMLASFSPNIEQTQRTVASLRSEGFVDIRTFETLAREMDTRVRGSWQSRKRKDGEGGDAVGSGESERSGCGSTSTKCISAGVHTAYLTFARKPVSVD